MRMCHLLKKLENESTKDEEREKQEKGGTHKGSESSVALLQSPPLYILYNHKDRCNLNCVCSHGCVILIPSLYSRSPLLFLLH